MSAYRTPRFSALVCWAAMARRALPATWLLLTACIGPPRAEEGDWAARLHAPREEERTEAFQWLLRRGAGAVEPLKDVLLSGGRHGFPAAALLYAMGEGDAVPRDIRARHLAAFGWPPAHDAENAVVEAYAWREVERDLLRDGRRAVAALASALERDAVDERRAVRTARVLLRLGRREAGDALAAMLGTERDLGGSRVCDVAAGALLFLGGQEAILRRASPTERVAGARAWWERAKDRPESEWTAGAVAELAERARPRDPEGVRGVLELLTGETIEDPAGWAEKNRDWAPAPPPLRPETLRVEFEGGRARAFRANALLEQATGTRVWLPRMETLSDLLSSLRLWEPPSGLDARWRRHLQGSLLRLSISAVGFHPGKGENAVLWNRDTYFHAGEEGAAEFRVGRADTYSLHVRAFDLGARLVINEFLGMVEAGLASVEEASGLEPFPVFSRPLGACVVVEVAETPARRAPRAPEEVASDLRRTLRAAAEAAPDGPLGRKLLRALGYFQDPVDLAFLRERKAGEALLLLGDPAALEYEPRLTRPEIEMALRKAEDPRVQEYLGRLQAGP